MIKMQMFPLDVCLLPGERLPLHIFENRYKELIQSCLNAGETFGIPFGLDEETRQIGAEVRVKKVLNTNEDGSLDIIVESVGSFNILDYRPEMDHRSCDTALVEEVEIEQLISRNSGLLSLYLDFRKEYFKVDELKLSFEDQNLIIMARSCGLSRNQKIRFLQSDTKTKEAILVHQLEYLLFIMEQDKRREFDILLN